MQLTVTLPWPSADLSQNSRDKWGRIKATKAYREAAQWWAISLMRQAGIAKGSWRGPVTVQYTFHARVKRARDDDNHIGMMKAARDGIALALGVNDSTFTTLPVVWGTKRTGEVDVTLTPALVDVPVVGVVS